jgi:hypothetical protein
MPRTRSRRPTKHTKDEKHRISLRLTSDVVQASDRVLESRGGLGTRSDVLRLAIMVGLEKFLKQPNALVKAQKITLPV